MFRGKDNILIDTRDGKSNLEAGQFYVLAGAEGVKCPEGVFFEPEQFDDWAQGIDKHIFLDGGIVAVIGKLAATVVGFGRGRKNFDDEARRAKHVGLSTIALIAAYRGVGIDITGLGEEYAQI